MSHMARRLRGSKPVVGSSRNMTGGVAIRLEIDEKQKSLSVSNDRGVGRVRQLLEEFEKSKIKVSGMSLSKPTLDDVFLKLTGHKAVHKGSPNDSRKGARHE